MSFVDVALGNAYSNRRVITTYISAFVLATLIRVACLSPRLPIFGPHLAKDLAPIERDDVSWSAIAANRAFDLAIGLYLWTTAQKVDGPLLGIVMTGISKVSVLYFIHHHFLLGTTTMTEILLTDAVSQAAAMGLISSLLPRQPSFRPPPISWLSRHANGTSLQLMATSLALGTCLNALITYVADHTYIHELMRAGVLDHIVPAYFAQYGTSFAMKYPSLPIPTLRSDFSPISMPVACFNSLPFVLATFILAQFVLPSLPSKNLSLVVFLLSTPATFVTLWNLMPVQLWAASIAAIGTGLRQSLVAFVMSEVLLDLRKPVQAIHEKKHERVVGQEIDGTKLVELEE